MAGEVVGEHRVGVGSICERAIAGEDEGQGAENCKELDMSITGFGNAAHSGGGWERDVGSVNGVGDEGGEAECERGVGGDGEEWEEAGRYVSSYCEDEPA